MPRTYISSLKPGALKSARIGVLTEFFGNALEDEDVASVAGGDRRDEDAGATAVDVAVPSSRSW